MKTFDMATYSRLLFRAVRIYWRAIFVVVYPLVLLPVFLHNNVAAFRCLYVVLLMAGYWVFEALPLPVTSLIPMVLFPLMGILDSDKTSLCYLKETNMMFVGGLVIAIAVEYCNLHTRVALYVIQLVGCSPRKLNFGLVTVTMFVSMWISNTAATAMMIPIIEATLKELETQGIGEMYESNSLDDNDKIESVDSDPKKPTRTTMCYFISTAYAASIGGMGCIVGSGTNLTFKGIYETSFPESPGIEFAKWMLLNVPMMILMMYLSLIWLQTMFMGLFRPNSQDAKKIRVGSQGAAVARKLIRTKINEMGPMSFHEGAVAALFCLSVLLWFFRKPQFIVGWAELITQHKVKDATAALIVVLLLFIIPARPDFIYILSKDESKRPKTPSPPLITWKVIQHKLPWGLIFLLGGGFALAEASKESQMSKLIADHLHGMAELPKFAVMVISCVFATVLTQFSSNVAVANVLLPVLAEMAKVAKVHPLYLMLPTSLCCSFAYCLPVSTPPNAIAAAPCNMSSTDMVKAGLGVAVISLLVLFAVFPFLGAAIWDLDTYPEWVE
ncbi:protein I'm not dead yet isoform X1 [Tribolium castaneum]|nr:PREDICTED: protein I'm not dead yet isoform X1 [Tribolium castaneum]XP_015836204.1 PREDICTED: protein I'm not dead yet isoform X2 [Tribolium castaneum]|eukprot:XP_015836203.1 PREDICTED: protein I'm not dead yet isoform X1 [Tribolium castaneum]